MLSFFRRLSRLEGEARRAEQRNLNLLERMQSMSQALDDLKAEVARNGTVAQSAVALIHGLADRLEKAISEAQDHDDDKPLNDLVSDLRGSSDALAKAVEDGTQSGGNNPQSGAASSAGSPADSPTQTGTAPASGGTEVP